MSNIINTSIKYVDLGEGQILIAYLQDGKLILCIDDNKYNISSFLDEYIFSFDIYSKIVDNKVQVSLAIVSKKDEKLNYYLTELFEVTIDNLDNFNKWESYPIDDTSISEDEIGEIINSQNGMAVSISPLEGDAYYYFLDINTKKWTRYNIPVNISTIQSMVFCTVYYTDGIYLFLEDDDSQVLMFQSFIDPKYGETSNYRFDCSGKDILKIKSVQEGKNTQLYAMYDEGIFLYKTPDDQREEIFSPEDGYLLEDFIINDSSSKKGSSIFLEKIDNKYGKDKTTHFNLSYRNDLFAGIKFSIVL